MQMPFTNVDIRNSSATSRKVACSSPDQIINFFICLILPAAYGPWVYSVSSRNEYQKIFLGSKEWPERKAKQD
jgi:hypothetical protein